MRLEKHFFWLRLFSLIQCVLIEITNFHAEISDMLERILEPLPLVAVQTTNTPSSSTASMAPEARASNFNGLFQDYYNNNEGENMRYDELEHYVAVVIPSVSLCDAKYF